MTISLQGTVKVDNDTGNSTSGSVTFDSIPADNDLIFLSSHGGGSPVFPTGFSTPVTLGTGAVAWKTASGEASATYTVTHGNDETIISGFVFRSTEGALSRVGTGATATGSTPSSMAATGSVDASSATGNFVAIGVEAHQNVVSAWAGGSSLAFGGTATGGSDVESYSSDPGSSSLDEAGNGGYRIFTGTGTVTFTPRNWGSDDPTAHYFLEVFDEASAGGDPAPVRRSLAMTGVGR